ncbi:MAG: hypothetical protein R3C03_10695 [Pirellulaceae bacterium]
MTESSGLVEALEPVAAALQALNVRFFVGGSIASAYHGASRSTMDVDLVADITLSHVKPFTTRLGNQFYLSQAAILDAINRLACFNIIHLPTSYKVDIFVFKRRQFDEFSMARAELGRVASHCNFEVPIASPEDIILSKLERYRLGNEVSERQWEDVVRVVKIFGNQIDLNYLNRNAIELEIDDLLRRVLELES